MIPTGKLHLKMANYAVLASAGLLFCEYASGSVEEIAAKHTARMLERLDSPLWPTLGVIWFMGAGAGFLNKIRSPESTILELTGYALAGLVPAAFLFFCKDLYQFLVDPNSSTSLRMGFLIVLLIAGLATMITFSNDSFQEGFERGIDGHSAHPPSEEPPSIADLAATNHKADANPYGIDHIDQAPDNAKKNSRKIILD